MHTYIPADIYTSPYIREGMLVPICLSLYAYDGGESRGGTRIARRKMGGEDYGLGCERRQGKNRGCDYADLKRHNPGNVMGILFLDHDTIPMNHSLYSVSLYSPTIDILLLFPTLIHSSLSLQGMIEECPPIEFHCLPRGHIV